MLVLQSFSVSADEKRLYRALPTLEYPNNVPIPPVFMRNQKYKISVKKISHDIYQ